MRNMVLLMAVAVALGGCGSEETDIREKAEVQTVAENEDRERKADEWRQGSDELGDITGDSPRELNEYRLCRKELETENGIYILELWLDQGIYGSVEELVQDFEEGDRMNFPGTFEIMVEDYNQDGCPDFTIGSYGQFP